MDLATPIPVPAPADPWGAAPPWSAFVGLDPQAYGAPATGPVSAPAATATPAPWRPQVARSQAAAALSFSLLSRPWLPARDLAAGTGTPGLWSLEDVWARAGTFGPLESGWPEVDLMLMRLLGAYLRRALPQADQALVEGWLDAGEIDPASRAQLTAYGQAHAQALDLFGPTPFLQLPVDEGQPGGASNWRQSAALLFPHLSPRANTNPQPHTWVRAQPGHDSAERMHVLGAHEALWGLLTMRSLMTGGLQRSLVYSAPASPLMDAWQVYPRGRTLLQGLGVMLLATPLVPGDAAPWETPQTPAQALAMLQQTALHPDRRPRGPVDCATWASRHVRLLPQPGPGGELVVAQILCDGGDRAIGKELGSADPTLLRRPGAPEPVAQADREAAKAAAKAAGEKADGVAYARVPEQAPRLWEIPALLQRFEAPVLRAARALEYSGALPQGQVRRMLLGVASNQSKILAIHAPVAPVLPRLGAEQGTLASALELARTHADSAVQALRSHVRAAWASVGAREVGPEAELMLARALERRTAAFLGELTRGPQDQPARAWIHGTLLGFAQACEAELAQATRQVWQGAQGNERLQHALVTREGLVHALSARRMAALRELLGVPRTPANQTPAGQTPDQSSEGGPMTQTTPGGAA